LGYYKADTGKVHGEHTHCISKDEDAGPNGVITITGNYRRSIECASAGSALAESLVIAEEKKRIKEAVALAQSSQLGVPSMSNAHGSVAFQATKETKKVALDVDFPVRITITGAGLTEK
jgi:hypothetical protein